MGSGDRPGLTYLTHPDGPTMRPWTWVLIDPPSGDPYFKLVDRSRRVINAHAATPVDQLEVRVATRRVDQHPRPRAHRRAIGVSQVGQSRSIAAPHRDDLVPHSHGPLVLLSCR